MNGTENKLALITDENGWRITLAKLATVVEGGHQPP
jgi:hypothetical protein